MSKTFYAKTANDDADSIDELLINAADQHGIDLKEEDITDELRQFYVDTAYDAGFVLDAVIFGEDYYVRNVNKKIAGYLVAKMGK